MSKPLTGQTALITGSSRGIGRTTALQLSGLGAHIVLNYVRNEDAAQKTAAEIRTNGVQVEVIQANVGDPKSLGNLVDEALGKFECIDILVHSAAIGAFKPTHQLRMNQWDLSMDINTKAFLNLVQKVSPTMEKKGSGTIIALSSLGAGQYIPNYGAIGVSKAALECLVRYLAVELAPKGIRVNAVSGGLVKTDAIQYFPDYEKFVGEVIAKTPMGRLGCPEDLANIITFLCLPESKWIIGQTLIADGGLSLI